MLLTPQQAYLAMFAFLERNFQLGMPELGVILSPMQLLPDGSPADPAFAQDWLQCVELAISGSVDAQLSFCRAAT